MKSNSNYRGRFQRPNQDEHRINNRIRVPKVRAVIEGGEQLGIIDTQEALRKAESLGLDLVEVAPTAKPPVCKIMDYGKYKFREQKKKAEAKKKRVEVEIKEIRIRYRTDSGDYKVKMDKARDFLAKGNKVKFSMLFRGREMAFLHLGLEKFKKVAEELSDVAVVDAQSPKPGQTNFCHFCS